MITGYSGPQGQGLGLKAYGGNGYHFRKESEYTAAVLGQGVQVQGIGPIANGFGSNWG